MEIRFCHLGYFGSAFCWIASLRFIVLSRGLRIRFEYAGSPFRFTTWTPPPLPLGLSMRGNKFSYLHGQARINMKLELVGRGIAQADISRLSDAISGPS